MRLRVLVTSAPAVGHLTSVLPAAISFHNAGHEVLCAVSPKLVDRVLACGLAAQACGPSSYPSQLRRADGSYDEGAWRSRVCEMTVQQYRDTAWRLAAGWDILVTDRSNRGARIAAALRRMPVTCVASGGTCERPAAQEYDASVMANAAKEMNLDWDVTLLQSETWIAYMPEHFHPPQQRSGNDVLRYAGAHLSLERSSHSALEEVFEPVDEPTVLLAFGTTPGIPRSHFLPSMAAGLEETGYRVVVASGGDPNLSPTALPQRTALVSPPTLLPWLRRADVVVTHGGFNTVTEALSIGRPLVVAPFQGDQLANAANVVRLGLGKTLLRGTGRAQPAELINADVVTAVGRVLGSQSILSRCADFAKRFTELPPIKAMPSDVIEKVL